MNTPTREQVHRLAEAVWTMFDSVAVLTDPAQEEYWRQSKKKDMAAAQEDIEALLTELHAHSDKNKDTEDR